MAQHIPKVNPGDFLPSGTKFTETHDPRAQTGGPPTNLYMEGKKPINTQRPGTRGSRGWERQYAANYEAFFGKDDGLRNVAPAEEVSEAEFAVLMQIEEFGGEDVDRDVLEAHFKQDKEIIEAIDQLLKRWLICKGREDRLALMADGRKVVGEANDAEEE